VCAMVVMGAALSRPGVVSRRGVGGGRIQAIQHNYQTVRKPIALQRRLSMRAEGEQNEEISENFRKRVQRMNQERLSDELDDKDKNTLPSADEVGVPSSQQPTTELANAKKGWLFNWPSLPLPQYALRIGGFYLVLGLVAFPFAQSGFDDNNLKAELVSSNMVALGILEFILLRLFITWDYIGQRLLSDRVEYEQTGWADGDFWEKPPQVLARDRLIHSEEVQPAIERIQQTLLAFAVALFVSASSFNSVRIETEDPRVTIRPSFLQQLTAVDEETREQAMAKAMRAAGEKPAYCLDDYYRARAGGLGC